MLGTNTIHVSERTSLQFAADRLEYRWLVRKTRISKNTVTPDALHRVVQAALPSPDVRSGEPYIAILPTHGSQAVYGHLVDIIFGTLEWKNSQCKVYIISLRLTASQCHVLVIFVFRHMPILDYHVWSFDVQHRSRVGLTHCPLEKLMKHLITNFQANLNDSWLWYLLWNYPLINVTGLYWWWVNIGSGNGLVPSGNKPLPEPMLTQISVAIWRH